MFQGYTGIQIREDQLVNDIVIGMLILLFVGFALVFRSYFPLLLKSMKDMLLLKERQSLFEVGTTGTKAGTLFFHCFMIFQALLLNTIFFYLYGIDAGYFPYMQTSGILITIGIILLALLLYYFFKKGIYALVGWIFGEGDQAKLWNTSYNATIYIWGILLYIPVFWLLFTNTKSIYPLILFTVLYILSRLVIIYKSIRIFHFKKDGFLYLFLYLCGQEIVPLFLFAKGSVFLYNFIELSTLWR